MISHTISVPQPSNPAHTGWVDVDVTGTPLAGVLPGTPVVLNPVDQSGNLTTLGLIVAYVSAPDVITFGVKTLTSPVDLLVSIP